MLYSMFRAKAKVYILCRKTVLVILITLQYYILQSTAKKVLRSSWHVFLSGIHAMWPNRDRRRAWTLAGCNNEWITLIYIIINGLVNIALR